MFNDTEKIEITKFLDNESMVRAVRKVFSNAIKNNELIESKDLDDARIGQIVRAKMEATGIINKAFEEMKGLSVNKKPSVVVENPAR